jgi:cysteinyl-tRNA synthetase
MGKSEGNFLTLALLKEKGYSPLVYRFFCLQTHYRQQLQFTYDALDAAAVGYESLRSAVAEYRRRAKKQEKKSLLMTEMIEKTSARFTAAVSDDLGTPRALAALFELIRAVNKKQTGLSGGDYALLYSFFLYADCALGLDLAGTRIDDIPPDVNDLSRQREKARQERKWSDADALRTQIELRGYAIEDTPDGARILKK